MPRYKAIVAYDGTNFQGFQRQVPGVETIQASLEDAISHVLNQPITITAAGRTDSGVHALGQVIAFDADWQHEDEALLRAINSHLPITIALQQIDPVHEEFHPRYDARSRTYWYQVLDASIRQPLVHQRMWQVRGISQFAQMSAAAQILIGEHDFATFGQPPVGDNTIRTIFRSEWELEQVNFGRVYHYRVEATAFLYHMVRRMVAMMVNVGRGQQTLAQFTEAFLQADVAQAKVMAPPQGLVLEQVQYHKK